MEIVNDAINGVRIKVTNNCQWTCTFCHNEGTELPEGGNASQRVSTFLDFGVRNLPPIGDMPLSKASFEGLDSLKALGISEVHLTGGEPTLHPRLPEIVAAIVGRGMEAKMTSNGQSAPAHLRRIIEAGLTAVNFSILSLDPAEFLKTQNPPHIPGLEPLLWAERMIAREQKNILLARDLGVNVKINAAVLSYQDYARVDSVREFAETNGIGLVILPSIGDPISQPAVFDYAKQHGTRVGEKTQARISNAALLYQTVAGTELRAKYLRPVHPRVVCDGCEHDGLPSCAEKFYGIRMEFRGGDPYVRLCVQKTNEQTVMPLDIFVRDDVMGKL